MKENSLSQEEFQNKLDQNLFIEKEALHLHSYLENSLFITRKFNQSKLVHNPQQDQELNRGQPPHRRPFQRNRRGNHQGQTFASDASRTHCPLCKNKHFDDQGKIMPYLDACPEFKGMSTDKQREMVIRLKHCLVCLRSKNDKDHTNPCSCEKFYCTFCPPPACKTHRTKY